MSEPQNQQHPRKPNRLINEQSPYLRQHAYNPVDWYPWGDEALKRAKDENKPILLSIGYSACHWCHVMERESFENEAIARLMNNNFVSIKVDREERPDLDQIYMDAVQMITGRGGWPLTMFLTPDAKPFFGGTYWPPEERQGMPPVPQVLVRTIPESGRKSLYLASHAGRILGMPEAEGRALIDELVAHATRRQFIYAHRWRVRDLVIWDNRCTMHRGTAFDDLRWKRDMQRATVCDEANTCEQAGIAIAAA